MPCAALQAWRLHRNLAESVDRQLGGLVPHSELRWYDDAGHMRVRFETSMAARRAGFEA